MKKTILRATLVLAPYLQVNSQDLKSKKGENYLPEAKDFALQIDAVPFLEYTGKLLSNAGANSPAVNSVASAPFTIGGKYFVKNDFAYRAKVRISSLSNTIKNTVINNAKTSTDTVYSSDSRVTKSSRVNISFGFEKRRGKTRLQGYYGAEAMLQIGGGSTKYNYANAYSKDNPSVFTSDFDVANASGYLSSLKASRLLQVKNGATFGLGARAFIGAEYFIFPKISLAAEFGWGIAYRNTNDGSATIERWDVANSTGVNKTTPVGGGSVFGVDTDNNGGQLLLTFHF